MFELLKTQALVRDINLRAENHGDDIVLGCDISLKYSLSNKKLELLAPGLLRSLYQRDSKAASADQVDLSLDESDDFLPHLRYPLLGSIPWTYKGEGYTFELTQDGLFEHTPICISDCKVNSFNITAEEGGTIKLTLKVQGNPTEDDVGELSHFIKQEAIVSLIAPKAGDDPQASIEDAGEEAAAA